MKNYNYISFHNLLSILLMLYRLLYNDFLLNKRLFQMFESIRNSQECANVFVDYVNRERKVMNDIDDYIDEDFINATSQPFEPDEEVEKALEEQHKQMEERNKRIIDKRKKDLGL